MNRKRGKEMFFPTVHHYPHYDSNMFLCTATKHRYVLEEYPAHTHATTEFNPIYDASQPITPTDFNESFQDNHLCAYHSGNQQHIPSSYNLNTESPHSSEIEFAMDKLGGNTRRHNDLEVGDNQSKNSRKHLLHNFFDFLAIAATCLIFGLIYLLVKPTQRGFYCDDTSIQYPYKPDTIPMWLLALYGGLGPVVIMFIVEIWVVRPFQCGRGPAKASLKQRRIDYLITILQSTFLFILGIAICFLITEVGKRTIGRLRPYYITACNPIWGDITCTKTVMTASGQITISQYVLNHSCNSSFSAAALQEAKLSFPSGHSSYSTYAFVFLFVYFEARLVCPKVQFLRPLLQCLCIAVAFFTCLSRVTDYKHHPTDVIGGAIIGFSIAIFAAVRVGTYLWSFSMYCETEDETKKDRLPRDERVAIPGIETRQSGGLRANDAGPLESGSFQNEIPSQQSRYGNRSTADNGIPMRQPKSISQTITGTGSRRVAPSKGFDEANG